MAFSIRAGGQTLPRGARHCNVRFKSGHHRAVSLKHLQEAPNSAPNVQNPRTRKILRRRAADKFILPVSARIHECNVILGGISAGCSGRRLDKPLAAPPESVRDCSTCNRSCNIGKSLTSESRGSCRGSGLLRRRTKCSRLRQMISVRHSLSIKFQTPWRRRRDHLRICRIAKHKRFRDKPRKGRAFPKFRRR